MIKRIKERNFHYFFLAFLLGLFIGINASLMATSGEPVHRYLDYFHRVYQLIRSEHVDVISNKKMFYGAIRGMIDSLNDPYSRFLDEKAYSKLKEMTTGKFEGVGIEITQRDGKIIVITPLEDSPAMKAGISAGDVIVKINGNSVKDKKLLDVIKMIKGLPGSSVDLHVKRDGFEEELTFTMKRKPINIKSVSYTSIKDRQTGYLKIKTFNSNTTREVEKALKQCNGDKINKLIIDLRFNPGGLLDSSIQISDLFLKKGKVIVSTKGREGSGNVQEYVSKHDPLYNGKIILLVNRGSASASEILSGAIQDNKRGSLLGEKTFGKGSVQKTYNLDSDIGLAITIAKYYTPSGRLIHKKGIEPDHKVLFQNLSDDDKKNLRILHKKKLMDKFLKKDMAYNDETKKLFHDYLKDAGISLSGRTEHYVLRDYIYRYKKKPLYDLEFDVQLVKALEIINE